MRMHGNVSSSPVGRRRTGTALWGPLALAVASAACGGGGPFAGQAPDPFAGQATAQEIRLRVRNLNFYDATLTALSDTGRRRLGTVGGNQTVVFTVPWPAPGPLRVEIDLLAGPQCTTDDILVSAGEQIDLEIMSDLSLMPYCR